MTVNYSLLAILILFAITISCRNVNYSSKIKNFPDVEFSNHWVIKLPSTIQKSKLTERYFPNIYTFSNDSMVMKLSTEKINKEEAAFNFKSTVENEKKGIATGPCLGQFDGDFKFHNFLDSANGLSGTILDLEEDGRKCVSVRIEEVHSGDRIDLLFENISLERRELIHSIIKNIKYKP